MPESSTVPLGAGSKRILRVPSSTAAVVAENKARFESQEWVINCQRDASSVSKSSRYNSENSPPGAGGFSGGPCETESTSHALTPSSAASAIVLEDWNAERPRASSKIHNRTL